MSKECEKCVHTFSVKRDSALTHTLLRLQSAEASHVSGFRCFNCDAACVLATKVCFFRCSRFSNLLLYPSFVPHLSFCP